MSSLIRVLLFDWMVTWRGPEGVGLVKVFLLLPSLPSGGKSCEMSRTHVDIQRILLGGMGLSSPYTSAVRGCKGRCEIFRSIITQGLDRQRICRAKLSCLYNSSICVILEMASTAVQVTDIPQKGNGINLSSKRTKVAACCLCPINTQVCSWVHHRAQVSEGLGNSSAWLIVMFGLDQLMIL